MNGAESSLDMLIFQVRGEVYGIDAGTAREILDPVPVTPLPFAVPEVEGLIQVSGRVILQLCVSRRLHPGDPGPVEDGVLIILHGGENLYACRVARILARATLPATAVSYTDVAAGSAPETPVVGEFSWAGGRGLLLASGLLLPQRLRGGETAAKPAGLVADVDAGSSGNAAVSPEEHIPCIVFRCNKELFAFRFTDVAEVAESGPLRTLPGAPPEFSGVTLLRSQPVPVLSMHRLLFGSPGAAAPYTLIVHLQSFRAGLQVEQVLGIQHVPLSSLRCLAEAQALLEGFVTTPAGQLVALVQFAALFTPERIACWRSWLLNGSAASAAGGTERKPGEQQKVLLFRVGQEIFGLPLENVERVEEFSAATETPGADVGALTGMVQVQGSIVPVHRWQSRRGVAPAGSPGAYIIIAGAGSSRALPVDSVEKIVALEKAAIEPVRSDRSGLFSGIGTYQGRLISILAVERLAA